MQRYRATPALLGGIAALAVILALVGVSIWRTPAGVAQEDQPILQYPDYPPEPTIGPNPTVAPSLASAPLYTQAFASDEALKELRFVDLDPVLAEQKGNWIVRDGRLVQDLAGRARNPSTHSIAALVADGSYGDVSVRASFYDDVNGVAGLVARYNGDVGAEASYYRFTILKNEYEAEPKQLLEKVVDGVATPLAELRAPGFAPKQWHVMELTAVGGQISVSVNGQVTLTAADPQPLPAGTVGVYTRAIGAIAYDDLIVSQP